MISQSNNYVTFIDKVPNKQKPIPPFELNKLKEKQRLKVLYDAYNKVDSQLKEKENKNTEIVEIAKYYNKVIMYQQKILSYSFTCIVFFFIGASLGSIIRKGGIGLPVVVSIFVFIIFNSLNLTVENYAWKGEMDPYLASWLPNMILLPFGVWLTYKALTDSQVFDTEKYKALTKPIWSKFVKQREHERYQ